MIRTIIRGALALAVLTTAVTASAQVQTGELNGIVRSSDDQALPGATVTVSGPALQGTRTVVTDQNGAYAIHALPPGSYDVAFELSGMGSRTQRVTIDVGRTSIVNTTLAPAGVAETVNVSADVAGASMAATQVGATYKAGTIKPCRRRARSSASRRSRRA